MSDGTIQEKCVFNREGNCYLLESDVKPCSLCFNFRTFSVFGKKRKPYYNLFDYLEENKMSDAIFPEGDMEQDSLKNI
jgi:hypothetical protein